MGLGVTFLFCVWGLKGLRLCQDMHPWSFQVLGAVLCQGALPLGSGAELLAKRATFLTMPPLQVNVKVKSAFNNKLFALNVVVNIPVPDNTAKADIQTSQGQQLALLKLPARYCSHDAELLLLPSTMVSQSRATIMRWTTHYLFSNLARAMLSAAVAL